MAVDEIDKRNTMKACYGSCEVFSAYIEQACSFLNAQIWVGEETVLGNQFEQFLVDRVKFMNRRTIFGGIGHNVLHPEPFKNARIGQGIIDNAVETGKEEVYDDVPGKVFTVFDESKNDGKCPEDKDAPEYRPGEPPAGFEKGSQVRCFKRAGWFVTELEGTEHIREEVDVVDQVEGSENRIPVLDGLLGEGVFKRDGQELVGQEEQ